MLLATENFRKLVDLLLLNCYSMNNIGILNGKAGISVALFEAARHLKDDEMEEHAFQVLRSALTERPGNISAGNGIAGAGYALAYLIRHGFIDAEYDELFKNQHDFILQTILKDSFIMKDEGEYIRLLLFLHDINIRDRNQQQAMDKLWEMTGNYYRIVSAGREDYIDCDYFFYFSTGVLQLASRELKTDNPDKTMNLLLEIAEGLMEKGRICGHPGFALALWTYGKKIQNKKITDQGQIYMEIILKNTIPGVSPLRQLTDTLLFSGKMMLSSDLAAETAYFFSQFTEERLKCSIPRQAYYLGVQCGIARLLLSDIYLEKTERAIPEILCLTL